MRRAPGSSLIFKKVPIGIIREAAEAKVQALQEDVAREERWKSDQDEPAPYHQLLSDLRAYAGARFLDVKHHTGISSFQFHCEKEMRVKDSQKAIYRDMFVRFEAAYAAKASENGEEYTPWFDESKQAVFDRAAEVTPKTHAGGERLRAEPVKVSNEYIEQLVEAKREERFYGVDDEQKSERLLGEKLRAIQSYSGIRVYKLANLFSIGDAEMHGQFNGTHAVSAQQVRAYIRLAKDFDAVFVPMAHEAGFVDVEPFWSEAKEASIKAALLDNQKERNIVPFDATEPKSSVLDIASHSLVSAESRQLGLM